MEDSRRDSITKTTTGTVVLRLAGHNRKRFAGMLCTNERPPTRRRLISRGHALSEE
jgi:hypothetical protein